jgi:hypothetical protein
MLLTTALLLAAAPVRSSSETWSCAFNSGSDEAHMMVSMSFWGPGDPMIQRPFLAIRIRSFSYDWNPTPRLLKEAYRDPTEVAFPLRLQKKPRHGHVVLTAPGESPVRIRMGANALWTWDVWHGAYLRLTDGFATARLLRVPRWTATVIDGRGRVQEVTTLAPPARLEVRPFYEEARRRMSAAARDPARSPLCKLDEKREDEGDIVRLSGSGSSDPA